MKRIARLAVLLITAILALSLSACGGVSGSTKRTSKNVFRVGIDENPEENAIMTKLIAGFKDKNPDVTITMRIESYSGNYSDKLLAQASAGSLPDLFFSLDSLVGYFASRKITVDVSQYFTQYGFSTDLIYDDVAKVGKVGEEIHMLGREYSQVVLYYNKTIFDAASQAYPTEDWTWDDMIAAGRALVQKDTDGTVLRAGIDMRLNWPTTILQYLEGHGGKVLNEAGDAGQINTASRTALTNLRDLVKEGVVLDTFGNTGLSFMSGNVGMFFGVRSNAATVNHSLTDWDVVHVPDMPTHTVSLGASGYSVSALSAHRDLALRFLFYILGEDGQKILAQTGNAVPALKSLADSNDWKNYPKQGINSAAFLQEENVTKVYPITAYMKNPAAANKLTDALNKQVISPILNTSGNISDGTWSEYETALSRSMQ